MTSFATVGPLHRMILKLDRSAGPSWKRTKKIPKQSEPLSVVLNEVSDHTISLITTAKRRHQVSDSVYPTSIIFAPSLIAYVGISKIRLRRHFKKPALSVDCVQEIGALPQDGQLCRKPRMSILTAFVPSSVETRLTAGMFLELMTVWKTKETSTLSAAVSSIAGNGVLPWLRSNTSSPYPATLQTDDDVIGTWKLRRTGVLFSKQKDSKGDEKWIFLIFIEPEEDKKHLVFTHREINDGGSQLPNTYHETGQLVYCFEREDDIKNLLNYIAVNLERGPDYLINLAEDILWGWGEFLQQMRGEILSVVALPEIKLTNL
jgi:hypothetical protein